MAGMADQFNWPSAGDSALTGRTLLPSSGASFATIADLTPGIGNSVMPGDMPSFEMPKIGVGGLDSGSKGPLGIDLNTGKLALSGLATIGQLWAAFQAQSLAKKQYNLTKKVTGANLTNQIQSYNTGLEDKIRSRAFTQGDSAASADAYLQKNKLQNVVL